MTQRSIHHFLILFLTFVVLFSSCKKPQTDFGTILSKETGNELFKKLDTAKYHEIFRETLAEMRRELADRKVLKNYYREHHYEPFFIVKFIRGGKIKTLTEYYQQAPNHGLNPQVFNAEKLKSLIDRIYDKNLVKTEEEACRTIARLEIMTANSLMKYAEALQYGLVDPQKSFARYYMRTARPDSTFRGQIFRIDDLKGYLDSIQPQSTAYKKLQEALAAGFQYPGLSTEATAKAIKLNLERLRWKNKGDDSNYVWVNIPDFSLTCFKNGKPSLTMKVCVGEAKESDYLEKWQAYKKSGEEVDRPHNHETPILNSAIHTIVVNPIWNIPKSIVQSEIAVKAAEDRYYLSNNNIQVFYKGQKIDPDNIDWGEVSKENMKLEFKQEPGTGNALGKMKFLFDNASSIYLHDTPAKAAFQLENRAISHGCIRVEDPLALARAITRSPKIYEEILKDFNGPVDASRNFNVHKTPVYIDYMTCWADAAGKIQIRPDVYRLDDILYRKMGSMLSE